MRTLVVKKSPSYFPSSFDQRVRDLSAEYGVNDIPQMASIMAMPVKEAQKMFAPGVKRSRQPSPWFQQMFLKLYQQKLEETQKAA